MELLPNPSDDRTGCVATQLCLHILVDKIPLLVVLLVFYHLVTLAEWIE